MKKKIVIYGVLIEIIFLCFYLVKYLSVRWNVENLYLKDNRIFLITLIILFASFIFYLRSVQLSFNLQRAKSDVILKSILKFSVIFNFSLLFIWNVASDDLYTHIQRGRMVAKYKANPYVETYDSYKFDEFYGRIKTIWSNELSIYGPSFTLLTAFISFITRDNLLVNILIFKSMYAFLSVLVGILIYRISKSIVATVAYSWNPLVIFETAINNHTDVIMIFLLMLSIIFLFSNTSWKRYILSPGLLMVGSLTKYFSFVVYPFFLVFALKKTGFDFKKLVFLFLGIVVQGILLISFYLP